MTRHLSPLSLLLPSLSGLSWHKKENWGGKYFWVFIIVHSVDIRRPKKFIILKIFSPTLSDIHDQTLTSTVKLSCFIYRYLLQNSFYLNQIFTSHYNVTPTYYSGYLLYTYNVIRLWGSSIFLSSRSFHKIEIFCYKKNKVSSHCLSTFHF